MYLITLQSCVKAVLRLQVYYFVIFVIVSFCNGKPTTLFPFSSSDSDTTETISSTKSQTTTHTSPIDINDGQSLTDKLKVMQLLSELERRLESKFRTQSNSSIQQEMPYIFEGDIILTPSQATEILESTNKRRKRKLHANLTMLWNLPIHFMFDGTHTDDDMRMIRNAIKYWEDHTCIKFLEVRPIDNFINPNNATIVFKKQETCWSYAGRHIFPPNYEQTVAVSTKCLYDGSILHELGHVIGFWHEHARPDRDDYVNIFMHNVQPHKEFNFEAKTWKTVDIKSVPYDVGSIMHYDVTAFSVGDQPTILSRDFLLPRAMGQRFDLTFYDVKLANLGYCQDVCKFYSLPRQCLHEGYQDPRDCTKCRCPEGLSGQFCEESDPPNNYNGSALAAKDTFPGSYVQICGGTVDLSVNVPVNFGISSYKYMEKCNWLFRAPVGTNIEFTILGNFLNYKTCSPDPNVLCEDYLEVKYNHSLAATGARLCCSNNMTSHPITSHGNEMLVLFRAYYDDGDMGFNASVTARSCGGCMSSGESATPCSRRVNYTCELWWTEKTWNACDSSTSDKCGIFEYQNKSRSSICYRDELYCCTGYTLHGSKCIAPSSISTRSADVHHGILQQIQTTQLSSTTVVTTDGWSPWSEWTNCSRPCGGCGTQSRSRSCDNTSICGDKPDETEIRSCNVQPCSNNTSWMCSRLETVTTYCGIFWPSTCTKKVTSTYVHRGPCCCDYELKNNTCAEVVS